MNFTELVQLYFERSSALQSYWTVYLIVTGALLGFSSMRKRPALVVTLLVSVLYVCFAYKNLDAIHEVVQQRTAVLKAIETLPPAGVGPEVTSQRALLNATMTAPAYEGVRTYHVSVDALALLAFWAMEFRRRRMLEEDKLLGNAGGAPA